MAWTAFSGHRLWRSLVSALILVIAAMSATKAEDKPYQAAAEEWLALVDGQQYDQSWQRTNSYFRGAVTRQGWTEAARGTREPLGELIARQLESATASRSLPGAPDGEYQVLRYRARFAHKASAIETITLIREDDVWKPAGYFIK